MKNANIDSCLGITALLSLLLASQTHAQPIDWKAVGNESVSMLSDYLQIDTTNPPGNEIKGAEFFAKLFRASGIESEIVESAPGWITHP